MTRKEHLDWCKTRALEYVENGNLSQAYASMLSDLGKHEETSGHPGILLGAMTVMSGAHNSKHLMTKFIEGFN